MPELPEVHTTVEGLKKVAIGLRIKDVWTSYNSVFHYENENIKNPKYFKEFRKQVVGKKIISASRRAKNVLVHLEDGQTILIHMKMTGHLLYGKYSKVKSQVSNLKSNKKTNKKLKIEKEIWVPKERGPLQDPMNGWIRFVITLSNGKHIALSDLRKFAKIILLPTSEIEHHDDLHHLGPEPLEKNFNLQKFKERINTKPGGGVKQTLMDQSVVAGIGNIYSDEILWTSDVHPLSIVKSIPEKNIRAMYQAIKNILKKGIDLSGDSMSDYRTISGEPGKFQLHHRAYQRRGERCTKRGCGGIIDKLKVGGRSAHFCPRHQRLFK